MNQPLTARFEKLQETYPKINFGSPDVSHPIQLISFTENKELILNEEALSFFMKYRDINFATISVVGKYRTGKSYFLNRVLLNRSDGFSVGPTINPCTKGLWIWPSLIEVENQYQKTCILVIDTEGIGAYNEEENHDIKIFLLAMLLSSFFVYNSVGNIDEMAIQNLSLIINLGKHLQKVNENEFDDLVSSFPNFLWVVRDFALKLVDQYGAPITSKEYLENALKLQKGMSESIENKNRIRRLITNFFKERDCNMLVRPIANENDIQNLANIPLKDLRPEFLEQILNLRKKIFLKIKPKSFKGKFVNGSTFIQMCKIFCESINRGEIPSIQNSWNSVCKLECQRLLYQILEDYNYKMNNLMVNKPISQEEFSSKHKELKKESVTNFNKNSFGEEKNHYFEELLKSLKIKHKQYEKENNDFFKKEIYENFQIKLLEIMDKLEKKDFLDYNNMKSQINLIKEEFQTKYSNNYYLLSYIEMISFEGLDQISSFWIETFENELKKKDLIFSEKIKNFESTILELKLNEEKIDKIYQEKINEKEIEKSKLIFTNKTNLEKMEKILKEKMEEINMLSEKLQENSRITSILIEDKEKLIESLEKIEKNYNCLQMENNKAYALLKQENDFLTQEIDSREKRMQEFEDMINNLKENVNEISKEKNELEINLTQELEKINNFEILRKDFLILENKFQEITKEKEIILNNAKIEKDYLLKELELSKKQIEDSKKNNELILKTFNTKKINDNQIDLLSFIKANKNLSIALEKSEMRCLQFEKKIQKLSEFQKFIKYTNSFECKFCHNHFQTKIFKSHISICQKIHKPSEESGFTSFDVRYELTEENKFKKEFEVEVNYRQKCWILKKNFKTFKCFAKELLKKFPFLKTKSFFIGLNSKLNGNLNKQSYKNKPEYFEYKRVQISRFLSEISKLEDIRKSEIYEKFLAYDIHLRRGKDSFDFSIDLNEENINENDLNDSITEEKDENNKENISNLSQIPKKSNLDYRQSLKNISFKDLLNQITNNNDVSNNKITENYIINNNHFPKINPHLNKLRQSFNFKTPKSSMFYANKDPNSLDDEKTIIKSPLEQEQDFKEHM